MSKIGEIRKIIKGYNGRVFSTSEVRKSADMYTNTYQRLDDLASLGEIEKLEKTLTGGRASMTWREIKINESLICEVTAATTEKKQSGNPWANVWPDCFQIPNLQGTVHRYFEAM